MARRSIRGRYHSELFHGFDGVTNSTVNTNGASILFNGELSTRAASGTTIGLLLMNRGDSTAMGTHAIDIQPGPYGWLNGIHFDSGGTGNIGVNFDASRYNMGIDLADNSLRVNANQKIILERFGTVYLRYNWSNNQVEVVKNNVVVASW